MPANTPSSPWANWMAAAHEAAQRMTPPTITTTTEEPVTTMEGGWLFEGKEKPVSPIICTRCQWVRRTTDGEEPDRGTWCESCLAGLPGPGHAPVGPKKPYVSKSDDVADYNRTFFGG